MWTSNPAAWARPTRSVGWPSEPSAADRHDQRLLGSNAVRVRRDLLQGVIGDLSLAADELNQTDRRLRA